MATGRIHGRSAPRVSSHRGAQASQPRELIAKLKAEADGHLLNGLKSLATQGEPLAKLLPAGGLRAVGPGEAYQAFVGAMYEARTMLDPAEYGDQFQHVVAVRSWAPGGEDQVDTKLELRMPTQSVAGHRFVKLVEISSDRNDGRITGVELRERFLP